MNKHLIWVCAFIISVFISLTVNIEHRGDSQRIHRLYLIIDSLNADVYRMDSLYNALSKYYNILGDIEQYIPFGFPVKSHTILSRFGYRRDPFNVANSDFHCGVDIESPTGDTVRVTASGCILVSSDLGDGFGKMVRVDHGLFITSYAHLSRTLIKAGATVKRGDVIGLSGDSGRCSSCHLHYQVEYMGMCVNPEKYLSLE